MLREMTSQHNEMHAPSSSNIDRQVAVEVCVCACVRLVALYEATSMSRNRQHWLVLVRDGAQRLLRRSWNNTLFRRQKKNTASIVEPLPRLIHAHSLIQNAKTTELRGAQALSSKIPPGVMELRAELRGSYCGAALPSCVLHSIWWRNKPHARCDVISRGFSLLLRGC